MTYDEAIAKIDFLNERFRKARITPWYEWAVRIDWEKVNHWCRLLGYGRTNP